MPRRFLPLLATAALLACAPLTPADAPPHPSRMGRFLGLVSKCGCADITASRMMAEFPQAVAGAYTPEQIASMRGYVDDGLRENYDNQIEICAEACGQKCAVQTIADALDAKGPGGQACRITEGSLHLTFGRWNIGPARGCGSGRC